MRLYKGKTKHGRSIYSSTDDYYVIEGMIGKWYPYCTPGGTAEKLSRGPFKLIRSAEYVCDYHRIIHNSPNGE